MLQANHHVFYQKKNLLIIYKEKILPEVPSKIREKC